jgi:hypothetical protein
MARFFCACDEEKRRVLHDRNIGVRELCSRLAFNTNEQGSHPLISKAFFFSMLPPSAVLFYVNYRGVLRLGVLGYKMQSCMRENSLPTLSTMPVTEENASTVLENTSLPDRRRSRLSSGGPNLRLWPMPPFVAPPFPAATEVLYDWAKNKQGARGYKLRIICSLLHEDYLLSLPLPAHIQGFNDLRHLLPAQLRYLFRRQCAAILG